MLGVYLKVDVLKRVRTCE